jgi:hypothetical protein
MVMGWKRKFGWVFLAGILMVVVGGIDENLAQGPKSTGPAAHPVLDVFGIISLIGGAAVVLWGLVGWVYQAIVAGYSSLRGDRVKPKPRVPRSQPSAGAKPRFESRSESRSGPKPQSERPRKKPSTAAPAPPPEVKVLVFGFNGSGKTLMLAALVRQFRFGGASGVTLRAQGEQQRKLAEIIHQVSDPAVRFMPDATRSGRIDDWTFRVRVDADHNRGADAFTFHYYDYAGEYAETAAGRGTERHYHPDFDRALRDCNILFGVLDGEKVRDVLLKRDASALNDIEAILWRLARMDKRCVHLVISKWDLLVEADRRLGVAEVVERLESISKGFREFRHNPKFTLLRIIPVSALGRDFAVWGTDGRGVKIPGKTWTPLYIESLFYYPVPDIFRADVAMMSAQVKAKPNQTSVLRESLSAVTWAILKATEFVSTVAVPWITTTIPINSIVEQAYAAVSRRRDQHANEPFDEQAALAELLRQCWAWTNGPDCGPTVLRSAR